MFSKSSTDYLPLDNGLSRLESHEKWDDKGRGVDGFDRLPASQSCCAKRSKKLNTLWLVLASICVYTIGATTALVICQTGCFDSVSRMRWLDDAVSTKTTVFYQNETFGMPSTPAVEEAWESIMPSGGGFIQDPIISPNISGYAVFHELHCLNALRRVVYAGGLQSQESMHNAPRSDHVSDKIDRASTHHHHEDLDHVMHCFDYLRQSIMCHADTNLEPYDYEIGGVTGWGFQRVCRDYNQVVEMASKMRYENQTATP